MYAYVHGCVLVKIEQINLVDNKQTKLVIICIFDK